MSTTAATWGATIGLAPVRSCPEPIVPDSVRSTPSTRPETQSGRELP